MGLKLNITALPVAVKYSSNGVKSQVAVKYSSNDIITPLLKSIRVHLSPGSSCGLVAYTLRILEQRYTFFMGHTAIFLLVGI